MDKTNVTSAGAGQHISRNGKFLLALIIVVAAAVGTLALFQPAASPAGTTGAAANTAPQVSLAQERAAEHRFLAQHSAASAAVVASTQRQEELKDQWLERGSAASSPVVSLAQERAAEHRFLAQRAALAAAVRHQDELKEQWLNRGNARIAAFVAATQRQEELKDQWLARNN